MHGKQYYNNKKGMAFLWISRITFLTVHGNFKHCDSLDVPFLSSSALSSLFIVLPSKVGLLMQGSSCLPGAGRDGREVGTGPPDYALPSPIFSPSRDSRLLSLNSSQPTANKMSMGQVVRCQFPNITQVMRIRTMITKGWLRWFFQVIQEEISGEQRGQHAHCSWSF